MRRKIALLLATAMFSSMVCGTAYAKKNYTYTTKLTPDGAPVKVMTGEEWYRQDLIHAGDGTNNVYTEYVYYHNPDSTTNDDDDSKYTYITGKNVIFPAWYKSNGYYYYRYDGTHFARNETTPDGYQVDDLGRWIDESGNPVTDGFGNVNVGTAEKYAGKSSDEIFELQRDAMLELSKDTEKYYISENDKKSHAPNYNVYEETDAILSGHIPARSIRANGLSVFNHNSTNYVQGGTYHSNIVIYPSFDTGKVGETALRIYLGDGLGKEVYDYLKSIQKFVNSDLIPGWYDIDYSNFDVNKFAGRKTDYGYTVYFEHEVTGNLFIYILNP